MSYFAQGVHRTSVFLFAQLLVFALILGGCDSSALTDSNVSDSAVAGGNAAAKSGDAVSDRYIVVFNSDVSDPGAAAAGITRRHGGQVGFVYSTALRGFSITGLPSQAVEAIERSPRVAYVERDDRVQLFVQQIPTGIDRSFASSNPNLTIDGADDFRVDVDVAIIDTGIDFEHPDLNVTGGVDCTVSSGGGPPWARSYYCSDSEGTGGDDDHYHGTHVGGTVAALDNGIGVVGVAPGARLHAVKVLDSSGSGYESGIVAGIDWVAANAATIEVANMSLGGSGYSQAEYDAIQGAVNAGVAFAVAAGNSGADASNYSPAAFDNALTVSALADFDGEPGALASPTCRTDEDDTLANFSNYGSAVQIAAPGVCILSTYPIEQGEYGTISGTSMASPHAAGALALLASANKPGNAGDVQYLYDTVIAEGNFNWTDDSGDGILEPLLDVSNTAVFAPVLTSGNGDGGGSTNAAPTAEFSITCADLTCDFDGSGSTDSDGSITDYVWDFGDGNTASGVATSHSFTADGTYTVTLTVTDDGGATDSASQDVSVSTGSSGGIALTVTGEKVRGTKHATLSWSGASSTDVDVYRDGAVVATIANDGEYSETLGKGGGEYTYQVCEAGTSTCSNEAVVIF